MRQAFAKSPCKKIGLCAAAIGFFDGLHQGHRKILCRLKILSRRLKVPSLVITFDVHPRIVLGKPFSGYLITRREKDHLFKSLGVDHVWTLRTSRDLLKAGGAQFLDLLFSRARIKGLVVGQDFCFGFNRANDTRHLRKYARDYGFKLAVVAQNHLAGSPVSSSRIREALYRADFKLAGRLLGRPYFLEGQVLRGRGLGRRLGFPTANIICPGMSMPPDGVYAAFTVIRGKRYLCAVNISRRLSPVESSPLIEAHVLKFKGGLRGRLIKIFFLEKVRPEKRFFSHRALSRAIVGDVEKIKLRGQTSRLETNFG